jgi:4-amino-4-deoxy-L-arabinose transferase-like glycosyltransferase
MRPQSFQMEVSISIRSYVPALATLPSRWEVPWQLPSWVGRALAASAFPTLAIGIGLLAVVLRLQHLTDIPRYTDEINEITPAFGIVRGTSFPLVSGPKHLGAFFDYVLAGAMLLFGRSPDLPRVVVLIAGLLTVLLTYGYARSLGGRWAGLLAAGLLAVSAPHVLLSSRVAWSASLTPLLGIGAIWALDLALSRRRPWLLVFSGLMSGLALQAHPSFVALLPGMAVFVLLRGRHLFRRPQLSVAGLVFVAAFTNVLLYNWRSGVGGLRSVSQQYPGEGLGLSVYVENLAAPLSGVLLALASSVDPTRLPSVFEPLVILIASLSLAALLYVARRVTVLPILVVVSALLVLPLMHDDFTPLLKARYTMPVVPVVYVSMALLLVRVFTSGSHAARVTAATAGLLTIGGLLGSLLHFESVALANDCTNRPQRAFVAELGHQLRPGEWILLDEGVLPSAERLGYLTLLELSSRRVGEARFDRRGVWKELRERPSFLTAVNDGKAAQVFEKQGLPLLPQTVASIHPGAREPGSNGRLPMQGIGLYRVSPEGATLLAHDAEPGCADLVTN